MSTFIGTEKLYTYDLRISVYETCITDLLGRKHSTENLCVGRYIRKCRQVSLSVHHKEDEEQTVLDRKH